jgi:nucleotide-binding universal stress UspA family protein
MFEKILVPVDNSPHSRNALEAAIQIAKKFSGRITLIHVYSSVFPMMAVGEPSTLSPGVPISPPTRFLGYAEVAQKSGERLLADLKHKVETEQLEADTIMEKGHAVQEIIRAAKGGSFDLIVMGARGVSHIREMLLGSVTDGVIHHADCPVLVIRRPDTRES